MCDRKIKIISGTGIIFKIFINKLNKFMYYIVLKLFN